jgi:hydrogenase maturation protein HypF
LFDAVSALAGVRDRVSFEGQAAMELEWLAMEVAPDGAYPFTITLAENKTLQVDTRPLIEAVAKEVGQGTDARHIARRFHSTLVEVIAAVCERIRQTTGIDVVVLSGGVFMNALLLLETQRRLRRVGLLVFCHQQVPPNDGGLSLGQLAIAACGTGPSC